MAMLSASPPARSLLHLGGDAHLTRHSSFRGRKTTSRNRPLILQRFSLRRDRTISQGVGLKPGDKHYRAYVGPPEDYDLVSAMVFNLLTSLGMRQHHRVIDVGCGSLRVGRLLIPYLGRGHYYGIEPNKWLVDDGIRNEVGRDLIKLRKPVFSFRDSMADFRAPLSADYVVAQSIFSHCGVDLFTQWLSQISYHLRDTGALLATFLNEGQDYEGSGWIYPGCVGYRADTVARMAAQFDLDFTVLDWVHPRQSWGLFAKKNYDRSLVDGGPIAWNRAALSAMRPT